MVKIIYYAVILYITAFYNLEKRGRDFKYISYIVEPRIGVYDISTRRFIYRGGDIINLCRPTFSNSIKK